MMPVSPFREDEMGERVPEKAGLRLWRAGFFFVGLGLAAAFYGGFTLFAGNMPEEEAAALSVTASPVLWNPDDWEEKQTGKLRFIAGLELSSDNPDFGGLSGLWISPDGAALLAVTDQGNWLSARPVHTGIALSALEAARLAPLRGPDGQALEGKAMQDAEGLALGGTLACVSFERVHRISCYTHEDGTIGPYAADMDIGALKETLPANGGLEALASLPGKEGAPALLAIGEKPNDDGVMPAAFLSAEGLAPAAIKAEPPFSITDAAFTAKGDLILLERRYSPLSGVGLRMRRIKADALNQKEPLTGEELLNVGQSYTIDNMEGLAIRETAEGRLFLYLISDDNFSAAQRTLLLQFELIE
jgi:hypothetical protein